MTEMTTMEVPNRVLQETGLSEHEVMDLIIKVANRIAPKYAFGFYDGEDLTSEAIIIGYDGLRRYDTGSLENFISCHISLRIKNFKRDHYYRPGAANACIKKALMSPMDIGSINPQSELSLRDSRDYVNSLSYKEMIEKIDTELPVSYRRDYLRMRDGDLSSVPPKRRKEVIAILQDIVGDEY